MEDLLRQLLDSLDLVGITNEEIYDSECRELMSAPIFHMFLKPDPNYAMPSNFGLYDDDANERVGTALSHYIRSANELAPNSKAGTFHTRLSAFQNGDVVSSIEKNYFDDFFGWANPKHFDEDGNVTRGNG